MSTTGVAAAAGAVDGVEVLARGAGPVIWISDEEWADVDLERQLLLDRLPGATILKTGYDGASRLANLRAVDGVLAQVYAPLPARTLAELRSCRGIAVMGGGYDRVDLDAASRADIPVCNVQGYCREDLAQYVVTAILEHFKPLRPASREVPWGVQAYPVLPRRVAGMTLYLVGYGRIGSCVAERAVGLGMRVIAHDPNVGPDEMARHGVEWVEFEEGFLRADVVSVHVNLTEQTRGLIGAAELRRLSSEALLVNTSRGAILDEGALIEALQAGYLAAAVLDVIEHEPPDYSEGIFSAPHATVTPHVSYASVESLEELRTRAVTNLVDLLAGRRPADCVNAERLPAARVGISGPEPPVRHLEEGARK